MSEFLLKPSGITFLDTMGTKYSIYLKPIIRENKNFWIVQIETPETNQIGTLSNTRGEVRYFKDINTAIALIKKFCPSYENIKLALLKNTKE